MSLRFFAISLLAAAVLLCSARRQHTTHKGKLSLEHPITAVVEKNDTVRLGLDDITFAGYEKAQNSTTESVFVTNGTDFYIKGINISIEYLDLNGAQLHRTVTTIPCSLPRGETRALNFKSWDKQHLWYYRNTQAHHNDYCTPYDVRIHLNYIIIPNDN